MVTIFNVDYRVFGYLEYGLQGRGGLRVTRVNFSFNFGTIHGFGLVRCGLALSLVSFGALLSVF